MKLFIALLCLTLAFIVCATPAYAQCSGGGPRFKVFASSDRAQLGTVRVIPDLIRSRPARVREPARAAAKRLGGVRRVLPWNRSRG